MPDAIQITKVRRFDWVLGPLSDAQVESLESAFAAVHVFSTPPRPVWIHVTNTERGAVHVCEWTGALALKNIRQMPERVQAEVEAVELPRLRGAGT